MFVDANETKELETKFRDEYRKMVRDPLFELYAPSTRTPSSEGAYIARRMAEFKKWNWLSEEG